MKIPYSVLTSFIPQLKQTPQEVAEALTQYSYEVEDVYALRDTIQNVVVGEIREIEEHPEATKLQITHVHVGDEEGTRQIICGASNIKIGQKVPVALEGARLPGDVEITHKVVRGQESFGMLCSKAELGLGTDSSGIYILKSTTEIGKDILEVLELDDTIIEIDNKGLGTRASDSMAFYGIARELASVLKTKLNPLDTKDLPKPGKSFKIKRKEELCSYYSILQVDGLSTYEFDSNIYSQDNYRVDLYVQVNSYTGDDQVNRILEMLGYATDKPAVNLSNYIMEEVGQPIHIFDLEKISGDTITIREAKDGEEFIDLKDTVHNLVKGDIVICDKEKIIALAGIIGAKAAAVDDGTRKILIESAVFNATRIRKTARRMNLLTGAAKRFERKIPAPFAREALERVSWFLEQAQIPLGEYVESGSSEVKEEWWDLDTDYIRKYLGVEIEDKTIESLLKRVGCEVKKGFGQAKKVKAPYWRLDLTIAEEFIEEVARLYGYHKIPEKLDIDLHLPHHDHNFQLVRHVTEALVALGYNEVLTYPYIGTDNPCPYTMQNPVDHTRPFLRTTLHHHMSQTLDYNKPRYDNIALFEVSRVFTETEELHLNIAWWNKHIDRDTCLSQVYADWIKVLYRLGINPSFSDFSLTSEGAQVTYKEQVIGFMDITSQSLEVSLSQFYSVAVWQGDLYQGIDKYPVVKRDMTVEVENSIPAKQVYDEIYEYTSDLCRLVELKDTFETDGKKRYTFYLEFRHQDRSLDDQEVNQEIERLGEQLTII